MRCSVALLSACILCAAAFAQNPPAKPAQERPAAGQSGKKTTDSATAAQSKPPTSAAQTATAQPADKKAPAKPQPTPRRPVSAVNALHAHVAKVDFDAEPLEDVLAKLADATGANIVARWPQLDLAGVSRDTPVTLHEQHVSVDRLLRRLMEKLERPDARLAYRAGPDMILISTKDEFDQEMVTRIYRVDDILARDTRSPQIFTGRSQSVVASIDPIVGPGAVGFQPRIQTIRSGQIVQFPNNSARSGRGRSGGGRSGGTGGVNDIGRFGENFDPVEEDDYDPAQSMQELIDVITATVDPESWDVNGGRGMVRPFKNMLIVRNTPFVHQQLGGPMTE